MSCASPRWFIADDIERVGRPCPCTDASRIGPFEDVDGCELWWQWEYRIALWLSQSEEAILRLRNVEDAVGEGSQRLSIEVDVNVMVIVDVSMAVGGRGLTRRWLIVAHERAVLAVVLAVVDVDVDVVLV